MKLMLDTQSPYIIKYAMRDGDYYVDDTMLKITVNGEPARVLVGSPYFPRCSFVVTVPGGDGGNLKKENLFFDYNANKEKNRASNNVYTKETADACCASFHPHDVVTITETHDPLPEFEGPNRVFLTKVIVDTGNKTDYLKFAHSLTQYMGGYYNLKEVWLSDKVNAVEFMRELDEGMKSKLYPNYYHFYGHSTMFLAGDATLCVPASQAAAVKAQMARHSVFCPLALLHSAAGWQSKHIRLSGSAQFCLVLTHVERCLHMFAIQCQRAVRARQAEVFLGEVALLIVVRQATPFAALPIDLLARGIGAHIGLLGGKVGSKGMNARYVSFLFLLVDEHESVARIALTLPADAA